MITRFEPMTIRGDGFVLRPLQATDLTAITEACTDPQTLQWLPLPRPYLPEHARSFVDGIAPRMLAANTGIVFAIDAGDGLVGCIDLKNTDWLNRAVEIGYWVSPGARGCGLATRAARRLAEWALREAGFERVHLFAATGNDASIGVARAAGFVAEGVARNAGALHDGRADMQVFSLVPADLR